MKKIVRVTSNTRALLDARIEQLKAQGYSQRNANEGAAMDMDMHTGFISKEDWPKGWKDPYPALEKALNAKSKTTAKAKAKK